MIDNQKIFQEIASIVRESGRVSGEIPEYSDLYAEVGVESVNSIAILIALEEKFQLAIDDAKFTKARTLAALVELVAGQVGDSK